MQSRTPARLLTAVTASPIRIAATVAVIFLLCGGGFFAARAGGSLPGSIPSVAGPTYAGGSHDHELASGKIWHGTNVVHAGNGVTVGRDYHHDVSQPLRAIARPPEKDTRSESDSSNPNPSAGHSHKDAADPVVQTKLAPPNMPAFALNFDGIGFPGFGCNCAPPDTNGEVGTTQYVQIVNMAIQVFDKSTGASLLGPSSIASLWTGFGGVCESNTHGDPVLLFDQIAQRWVVSQFAGVSIPTDECIAVSTGPDATSTFNRYAFHLGSNFFDYPHLGVGPTPTT